MHAVAGCHGELTQRVSSHHRRTVAAEAHVPGPGRTPPIPKNVATSVDQRGAEARAGGTPALRSRVLLALFFVVIFLFF